MQTAEETDEQLGEICAPSGTVLLLDGGLLNLWSHERPPLMRPGDADPTTVARANGAVDLRIEGPDAETVGRALDRQWHPLYLFDIPAERLPELQRRFDACRKEAGPRTWLGLRRKELQAHLVPLAQRVPHRERVALALAQGTGAGVVQFHGIWGVAVSGLPSAQRLALRGRRFTEGVGAGRWRTVWLDCQPGATIARSEEVGFVLVDEARILAADVEALGAWEHDRALDGKADLVFWGRDAAEAAKRVGAAPLELAGEPGAFGWRDVPDEASGKLGGALQALRAEGLKFATDYRPHSHAYAVMQQVRASPTESGELEVGGARVCMLMTTWGDGAYPVYRDLDAAGALVRVRLELGHPDIVERQRRLNEEWGNRSA